MLRSLVVLALCAPLAAAQSFTQKPEVAPSVAIGETPKPPDATGAKLFAAGPTPLWVWGADNNKKYTLTKTFAAPNAKTAVLKVSADNHVKLSLNGKQVAATDEWAQPAEADVAKLLKPEGNVLSAEVWNSGGVAGFVFKLAMTTDDGKTSYVVTDETWTTDGKVKKVGTLGDAPWGNVFDTTAGGGAKVAANTFVLQPGFRVTKLFTVPKAELGSWVCLTHDDKGRLIASDQGDRGLVRITPPKAAGDETKVERIPAKVTSAQGLLWHNGGLYVVCNGGPGSGLYRVTSSKNDDTLDKVEKLKALPGGGEHGPHAVRLAPDGKSLYVICGNHTKPPEGFTSRVPKNWAEDHLLPRQWDAQGHATGILAPGGYVAKADFDGKNWEIFTSGYRNPYDFAFNADGEMFVYDADMEWDMGMPWYRPTRVNHATSGSELGWRSGTGKWPSYYVDSLPAMIDIGPGSPVGVEFGYGARFPAKYQKALYICDWTFGTMYAVHTTPSGSTYTATKEEFLSRTPLPLTDVVVNPHDGLMYFTVGGRGANSELYRVEYVGKDSTAKVEYKDEAGAKERALRQRIEMAQNPKWSEGGRVNADDVLVHHLMSSDRFIRYAARVAVEHQPGGHEQHLILQSGDTRVVIEGAVALARRGEKSLQPKLLSKLNGLDFAPLGEAMQLDLLRAYQLVFTRLGEPDQAAADAIVKKLDPLFPAKSDDVNRELVQVLIYLKSPTVLAKTLALMKEPSKPLSQAGLEEVLLRNRNYGGGIQKMLANAPDLQKLHYAFVLRNVKTPWTLDQYRGYFEFLKEARSKSGGASYQGFINNMEKDAFANASDEMRLAIEANGLRTPYKPKALPKPIGPGRDWTTADVVALEPKLKGRNFKAGQAAFAAARCVVCHRVGGEGGATGPDLSQVAGRFGVKDLAEAIVEPSKIISDQYKASVVRTAAGKTLTGKLLGEEKGKLRILTDPEDSTKITEVAKDDVEEVKASAVSLMPADLLKPLNESEVLDMLAYMLSRGDPGHAMFRK
jgi:putative heme-binding domain-containing protein